MGWVKFAPKKVFKSKKIEARYNPICEHSPIFSDIKTAENWFKEHEGKIPEIISWRDDDVYVGAWVIADDGSIQRVLSIYGIKDGRVVKTCCGTFIKPNDLSINKFDDKARLMKRPFFMIGEYPKDRHTFDGEKKVINYIKPYYDKYKKRFPKRWLRVAEIQFALYVANGMEEKEAVLKAFPYTYRVNTKLKSLKYKPEILEVIRDELRKKAEDQGINDSYVIDKIKEIIETSEEESVKFKALVKLAEQIGTFKTDKEFLEEVKRNAEENDDRRLGGFSGFKEIANTKIEEIPEAKVDEQSS